MSVCKISNKIVNLRCIVQALLFTRTLEELEGWVDEVESQLQSEDHGKDLASTSNLLKRHTLLEHDVTSHGEQCSQLADTAAAFQRSNHFMKEEIQERAHAVINRYYYEACYFLLC